jgi:predicted transcriptional regulator
VSLSAQRLLGSYSLLASGSRLTACSTGCVKGAVRRLAHDVRPSEQKSVLRSHQEDQAIMLDTTIKHRVLKAIEELPQDATFEDVMERLYFLYKIDKGLKQVEAGATMSHEEAMEHIKTWHA